ncbi:hypothetical protein [Bdellovibrio bacteriovorus]|uniref:hypothetical protein n=1 Tax=Bdellovibrio bacteriovorus TaxID=959 RepID=UPI0035A65897
MKTQSLMFVLVGFLSSSSFATEAQPPCIDCSTSSEETESLSTIKQVTQALTSGQRHLVDAYFFADTKPVGKELDIVFKNPQDLGLSLNSLTKVHTDFNSFLAQKNLQEALKYTKTAGAKLNHEEKMLLLSMLGSRLSAGYSATGTENKNLEAVYQNAVRAHREGGVCGDIHKLLGEVAKSLGFEAVGRHNGQWQQNLSKDDTGGHAILHFRDPKTGEYYVQNYSQIFNTKQKSLQSAVDVSSKVLGVLTGTQYVESRPGKLHEYVPATAQWVQDQIQGVARFRPHQSTFTVRAGEHEQTLAMQLGNDNVKGFMLGSRVVTDEGAYRLEAAGISTRASTGIVTDGMVVDEIRASAEAYGGALRISAPGFDAMSNSFKEGERSTLFFGSHLKGTARINNTTGRLEFNAVNFDTRLKGGEQSKNVSSGMRNEIKAGVDHEIAPLNLTVSADRTWSWVPMDIEQKHKGEMVTSYDRVGIMYDTSKPGKKEAYLIVGTDVYFLEGVNTSSAVALKNSIKAVIPTEKLGTFSVGADLGRVVSNKSKDPFYDLVPAASVSVDWNKKLNNFVEIGATASYTKGNQITPFGVIGPITPVMGTTERKVQGMIYLHAKF